MLSRKNEIISIKKLKKDGSINIEINNKILNILRNGDIVVMPAGCNYGIVGFANKETERKISGISGKKNEDIVRLVSSFKMLDEIAIINKFEYDFLHRIWPGDVIVKLKKRKTSGPDNSILVQIPKNKFFHDIVDSINSPLLFAAGQNTKNGLIYLYKDIIKKYKDEVDLIVIIEEFCKEHSPPTIVDVSKGNLSLIHEGRIHFEEIKSLYFIDRV